MNKKILITICLTAVFILQPKLNIAQTTFTATNAQISNTLTSGGLINAHCIHASDTIIAGDDIIALQNVNVAGNINLAGSLIFDQASVAGFKYLPANTVNNPFPIISFGKASNQILPHAPICPAPGNYDNTWILTNGGFMSHYSFGPINAGIKMYTATWNGWGHIEVEGKNGASDNGLAINYFCGRETHINTNSAMPNDGGWVRMGGNVSMKKHLEIGDPINLITNAPTNEALSINVNSGRGIVFHTSHYPTNLISVDNPNFPGTTFFTLRGDGVVQIGKKDQASTTPLLIFGNAANQAIEVKDASNAVNFRVKTNGFVFAREVRVMTGFFPDYVFGKSYKLLSIPDYAGYILKNKHLPGFESEDFYIENGINTSEMFVKQMETIEVQALYIIELEKRITALENRK